MKHAITGLAISALLTFTSHAFAQETPRRAVGLGAVGQAVPGASVLSTARIAVTPAAGGNTVYLPLAADGSFKADGLAPGRYRLAVTSHITGKQTQGSTFGEKVNQGLHAAGSAVASGATSAKHDTVKNSINNVRAAEAGPSDPAASSAQEGAAGKMKIDGSMPNRISMNVTIAKQDRVLELDGPDMEIEVADGQALSGRAVVR